MTGKYTPGPWVATTLGNVMAGGTYIAHTDVGNERVNAANAQLIAAAPDLLEVCKAMVLRAEEGITLDFILDEARHSIAKAEGRA